MTLTRNRRPALYLRRPSSLLSNSKV